jgi:hypothetical protein
MAKTFFEQNLEASQMNKDNIVCNLVIIEYTYVTLTQLLNVESPDYYHFLDELLLLMRIFDIQIN